MNRAPIAGFALVAACGLAPVAARAEPPPVPTSAPSARSPALELVVPSEEKLTRLELRIEVDGRKKLRRLRPRRSDAASFLTDAKVTGLHAQMKSY